MGRQVLYIFIIIVAGFLSCKKIYAPELTTVSTNFLAVDGPIISGDSTFIRLSRTTSLSDTTQNKAELRATIAVESDQNTLFPLIEKGKGLYVLGVTNFDAARKYRLDIKTSNGKIYQSDFVPAKTTPPIDSVYFEVKDKDNIMFYLNAHDATNSTRYYRWDYTETWRFVSLYKYDYLYKNGVVSKVTPNDVDISTCYKTSYSNEIFTNSSAKLANDVITRQQLGGVISSEKIVNGYVFRVKQYALTKEGFEYYQSLKTNTEQLGSIFDSQPSFLKGNIHCISNPPELVVGFVSISTVNTKQVNLNYAQIPLFYVDYYGLIQWNANHAYNPFTPIKPEPEDCPTGNVLELPAATFKSRADAVLLKGDQVLFEGDLLPPATIHYIYYYAPKECVDCRTQGGNTTKPAYFPF